MEKKRKLIVVLLAFCVVSVPFGVLFLDMAMVKSLVDTFAPCMWVEPPTTDMLRRGNTFTVDVMVNITDPDEPATGLYGYVYKLKWNSTMIHAVNITYNLLWDTYTVVKNETNEFENGTGYHWLGMAGLTPSPAFTGYTSLCMYSFHVEYQPFEPEPALNGTLEIQEVALSDDIVNPINATIYDGEYRIISIPPLKGFFDSSIEAAENSTINPCLRKIMLVAAVNHWLQDWNGILPNETIPETLDIHNTFLERGDRLLQTLDSIYKEGPYTTPYGPDEKLQHKELMEVVVIITNFVINIINIVIIPPQPGPVPIWIAIWDPDVSNTPEELAISGYVTYSSAFVVLKEVKGIMANITEESVWFYHWLAGLRHARTTHVVFTHVEFIKTIIYEYVYDDATGWNIQQTVDKRLVYEEELGDFWEFLPAAKDP